MLKVGVFKLGLWDMVSRWIPPKAETPGMTVRGEVFKLGLWDMVSRFRPSTSSAITGMTVRWNAFLLEAVLHFAKTMGYFR